MNNSVAVFILALLLTSVLFALVSGDDGCDGFFNSTFTKLNFSNANVVTNELHLNGNLTYGGESLFTTIGIEYSVHYRTPRSSQLPAAIRFHRLHPFLACSVRYFFGRSSAIYQASESPLTKALIWYSPKQKATTLILRMCGLMKKIFWLMSLKTD